MNKMIPRSENRIFRLIWICFFLMDNRINQNNARMKGKAYAGSCLGNQLTIDTIRINALVVAVESAGILIISSNSPAVVFFVTEPDQLFARIFVEQFL